MIPSITSIRQKATLSSCHTRLTVVLDGSGHVLPSPLYANHYLLLIIYLKNSLLGSTNNKSCLLEKVFL